MDHDLQTLIKDIPPVPKSGMILIGIDGCGGAGKSTFSKKLAVTLHNSQIIHIDDFYKPKEQRIEITEKTPVHANFEFGQLKEQVLQALKKGAAAKCTTPTGKDLEIQPQGYVIVEGLGALGFELKKYFDYKIWIDAPEIVRRQRGIERDTEAWTNIWDEQYLPQDARYIREQLPAKAADWILNNN